MPNKELILERPRLAPYQKDMLYCDERNSICEATTKAGKTFSHMWWLFEQAHKPKKEGDNYWWVAPIYSQAKIAFTRIKRTIPKDGSYAINQTDLTITTPVGSVMWFKSGDNPDSLYGEDVRCAVLDEVSRMREESFFAVRSTLTATKGAMKLIGNVKGTGNWAYKLARKVENGEIPDWKYFKITCDDAVKAGILDQSEIDAAKAIYPSGVFLELYYGIPFVNSSNKFAFAFDKSKCVAQCSVNYDYPIYLSFDFNRNPISCAIIQYYDETVHIPHVIKLENSDIYRLCTHIKNKFTVPGGKEPHFIVNGDASGRAGSAMVKDNLNYFRIIKTELNLPIQRMQQLAVNPRIEENQVLVNAVLEHVKHKIDPTNAQALIFDLEFAEMLPDGTLKKSDREDPTQQLDALDCARYWYNRNMKHFLKGHK